MHAKLLVNFSFSDCVVRSEVFDVLFYIYIYMLHVFVCVKCYILKGNEENRLNILSGFLVRYVGNN